MEVMIPSPQASQPSSPKGFMGGYYFSAPTSPSHHLSQFYTADQSSRTGVPFDWEEKPGTPPGSDFDFDFDFAFDVSEDWGKSSQLSAEELFDSGVIKPLTPPPRLQNSTISAKTPTLSHHHHHRGREREGSLPKSSSRRAARSLSPLRDNGTRNNKYPWLEEEVAVEKSDSGKNQSRLINDVGSTAKGSSKKWRLKDFFLFRSASEGRAADKDPLNKYTAAYRHSSFRATTDGTGGSRRRGPPVSPHERHYTVNRAVSEDLKKKTFLPYKQGIIGRLSFNPAVHALANGFGFSKKS